MTGAPPTRNADEAKTRPMTRGADATEYSRNSAETLRTTAPHTRVVAGVKRRRGSWVPRRARKGKKGVRGIRWNNEVITLIRGVDFGFGFWYI